MNIPTGLIRILLLLLISQQLLSQTYSWKVKTNYPGAGTAGVSAFSINNKGYFFGGFDSANVTTNEIWEYDHTTNVWTQKATFPGDSRVQASGFSVGSNGYICGGWNKSVAGGQFLSLNDLWKYSKANNSWSQKASLPAYGRYNGSSFVIGSKAYFGLGYAPMSSDFYEYETLTDVWTPVTPAFPGGARMNATAFTLTYLHQGNSLTQGFVGGGASADNTTSQLSDFYSFTPGTIPGSGSWAPVAAIPVARYAAFSFTLNDKAYVGCGIANGNYLNDFYEYDPVTDTWLAQQNYPVNMAAVKGFSIGNNGYAGTGTDGMNYRSDFYEWSPGFVGVNENETGDFSFLLTKHDLQLTLSATAVSNSPVYLYTIDGKLSASGVIEAGKSSAIIDMKDQEAGVYLVGVYINNTTLRTVKFYKDK